MSDRISGSWADHANPWTPDKVVDLINSIGPLQRAFLLELARSSRKDESLIEVLGLDSGEALAGVLSGLSKQLGKMPLRASSLYTVEVKWIGKGKTRSFMLTPDFREVADGIGWPDAWEKD